MTDIVKLFEYDNGSFAVRVEGAFLLFLLICAVTAGKQ